MVRVLVNGAAGRMGSEVVNAVNSAPGLELVASCDRGDDLADMLARHRPDVAVDFTIASAGFENCKTIINAGVRPVIGTSGFMQDQVTELTSLAAEHQLGGLIAPNFSLGAVLMMKFAAEAARWLPDAEVIELHSPQKEESPSGTALRTAELINAHRGAAREFHRGKELFSGARGAEVQAVGLHAVRLPGVVAQQMVLFGGESETLRIEHSSNHRASFMPGVVMACHKVMTTDRLVYGLEHLLD